VGIPKSPKLGLLRLWSPITLQAKLQWRCSLKQSCSSYRELSKGMSHALRRQVNWVDSWLFMVRNQIGNLTPNLSFGHNLCFKCPNEQCKPILASTFQDLSNDIKNATSHWVLTPEIALWSFGSPKWTHHGSSLENLKVDSFTLFALPRTCDVIPGSPTWPTTLQPLVLVASPKLGLQHAF
jgi:hypothetical protein